MNYCREGRLCERKAGGSLPIPPLLSLENRGSEPHPSLKAGSHRRPEYRNRRQMCPGAAQMLSGNVTLTQNLPRNLSPRKGVSTHQLRPWNSRSRRPGLCLRLVQAAIQENIKYVVLTKTSDLQEGQEGASILFFLYLLTPSTAKEKWRF